MAAVHPVLPSFIHYSTSCVLICAFKCEPCKKRHKTCSADGLSTMWHMQWLSVWLAGGFVGHQVWRRVNTAGLIKSNYGHTFIHGFWPMEIDSRHSILVWIAPQKTSVQGVCHSPDAHLILVILKKKKSENGSVPVPVPDGWAKYWRQH